MILKQKIISTVAIANKIMNIRFILFSFHFFRFLFYLMSTFFTKHTRKVSIASNYLSKKQAIYQPDKNFLAMSILDMPLMILTMQNPCQGKAMLHDVVVIW